MKNRNLVYDSLETIEKNLRSDVTVYSLSEQYGFSPYYFSRLFKAITGHSLKKYIQGRKMAEACKEVVGGNRKIVDIALDYGFSTHESFSRSFYTIYGLNPAELRRSGADESPILDKSLKPLHSTILDAGFEDLRQEPELVTLDEFTLLGLPFYFDLTQVNDLSKPWGALMDSVKSIEGRLIPEKYYQVQYWLPDQDPASFFFFVALEVASEAPVPIQFTAKKFPSHTYLKFYHHGVANSVGKTYNYIYEVFLPETTYRLPHLFCFEYYGDRYKGPYNPESVSEIYIPVELRE